MCGICGKIMVDPHAPVDGQLIKKMADTIRHRGPDDGGVLAGPGFGLGHARLSIIDLSEAGRQPISNEDKSLHLVFNGEIYNFQGLREELKDKGHLFRSRTDGEVILHLYEEYGEICLDHLRGMFAFAIYNSRDHTLFAARDRIGKKPFVYTVKNGAFIFASEIKAILEDPDVNPEPDNTAIHHYLSYQYVPGPWTSFKGIKKLNPGCFLTFKSGKLTVREYWRLSFADPIDVSKRMGEEELADLLLEKFKESVKIRLMSDVPMGAFLSGGVDSGAVTAVMQELTGSRVKTFSIGFENKIFDESHHAREMAARFDTDHTELVIKPDAVAILPKLVWHYNEPFADSSGVPTFYLAEMAAKKVKVVLNGDGGDENFAGYSRYRAHSMADKLSMLPRPLLKVLLKSALWALPSKAGSGQGAAWQAKRFLRHADAPREERNFSWFCYLDDAMKDRLYSRRFKEETRGIFAKDYMTGAYNESDAPDFINRILDTDIRTYLPHDLLVKADIATMAHSLEGRSPLLDQELMEFAARIPATLKLKGLKGKHILKSALCKTVPSEVLKRPKKGFGVPIDDWLRGDLKEMAFDTLTNRKAVERGLFDVRQVSGLLKAHINREGNYHREIWALLMLELWFCMFIDP